MTDRRHYRGPQSDHFDGERFFNPGQPSTDKSLVDLLRWRFTRAGDRWPTSLPYRSVVPDERVSGLRVTAIGHASLLVQTDERNVLVDPVWSDRTSPVTWAGPRRVTAPAIAFDALPPIDLVLLTHNHYDHCDIATLTRLWQRFQPRLIAPLGNDTVVARSSPDIVVETFDWGAAVDLGGDLNVTLTPALHWSARSPWDRRRALWSGFVIASRGGTAYVSGDTGYGDGHIFRDVGRRFPQLDVAILPIGAYEPRWFMKTQHIDPDEAVQAMLDCGATAALGVHWGTFPLSDEGPLAPSSALKLALAARGIEEQRFHAMVPGDTWDCRAE